MSLFLGLLPFFLCHIRFSDHFDFSMLRSSSFFSLSPVLSSFFRIDHNPQIFLSNLLAYASVIDFLSPGRTSMFELGTGDMEMSSG